MADKVKSLSASEESKLRKVSNTMGTGFAKANSALGVQYQTNYRTGNWTSLENDLKAWGDNDKTTLWGKQERARLLKSFKALGDEDVPHFGDLKIKRALTVIKHRTDKVWFMREARAQAQPKQLSLIELMALAQKLAIPLNKVVAKLGKHLNLAQPVIPDFEGVPFESRINAFVIRLIPQENAEGEMEWVPTQEIKLVPDSATLKATVEQTTRRVDYS